MTGRLNYRDIVVMALTLVITVGVVIGTENARAGENKLTDENICDAVEDRFFFDQAVPFDRIDSVCRNGIVSITGTTNNLLAKKRATRLLLARWTAAAASLTGRTSAANNAVTGQYATARRHEELNE